MMEHPYRQILFLVASRGARVGVELGPRPSLFFHSPKNAVVVLVAPGPGLHVVVVIVVHDAFAAAFYLHVVLA